MARHTHPNPRETTEQKKRIELTWLRTSKYLQGCVGGTMSWSYNGQPSGNIHITVMTLTEYSYIQLTYKIKNRWETEYRDIDYKVYLESNPCKYGGKKWFFTCGYRGCTKRVRILYEHCDYFTCRICANLSYSSCNTGKRYRAGYFKVLTKAWGSDDYYRDHVKTRFYRGKPTRKYRRYLKMNYMSDEEVVKAEQEMFVLNQKFKE